MTDGKESSGEVDFFDVGFIGVDLPNERERDCASLPTDGFILRDDDFPGSFQSDVCEINRREVEVVQIAGLMTFFTNDA
ncbi:MAG: hypothetical protein ACJAVK_000814 [Akkermansiaceae bacterium]